MVEESSEDPELIARLYINIQNAEPGRYDFLFNNCESYVRRVWPEPDPLQVWGVGWF